MDFTKVPGVLLSNRKIDAQAPALTDIAPTILVGIRNCKNEGYDGAVGVSERSTRIAVILSKRWTCVPLRRGQRPSLSLRMTICIDAPLGLMKGRIMFGSHKVKIEGELLEKVKQCSDAAGYESIDEFVIHMLEKETKKILPDESSTSKEEIQKRLRGLGYIE